MLPVQPASSLVAAPPRRLDGSASAGGCGAALSARRAAAACRRARARFRLPLPGSTSALPTSVQGCASSERRIPPGRPGHGLVLSTGLPPGPRRGPRSHRRPGDESVLPAASSPTRDRPTLHSGPAPYRPRAKTGLRSSRLAWTGSVRVPGAGQVNEGEAQFFSEGREHAPAEGLVATQGIATAPAT